MTALKILFLVAIYAVFFWGTSHRLPADAVAHIAGAAPNSETR